MEVIEEVPTTKKVVKRYCDDCGAEIHWSLQCEKACCAVCGKMLCEKCIAEEVDAWGDHRKVYCKSCKEIYEKYKPELDRLYALREGLFMEYEQEAKSKRGDIK